MKLKQLAFIGILIVGLPQEVLAQIPTNNLRLHLEAGSGVTDSGGEVSAWTDQSGNGNNATQTTVGVRPTLVTNSLNGEPVLRFTGGQFLNLAAASAMGIAVSDYEMFIVYRSRVATNSTGDIQFLLSGALEQFELHTNGSGNGLRYIPNELGVASNIERYIDVGSTGDYTNTSPHIIRLQATGSNGDITVNGTDNTNRVKNSQSSHTGTIQLGKRADGSYALEGDIAEIIIYNTTLSALDRGAVENYLGNKYGITVPVASPSIQASNVIASEISNNSLKLNLTPGNGSNRLVIAKAGSAVDGFPVDNQSYTANAAFGSGTEIGSGNFVVFNGTGDVVSLTELNPGVTYHFYAVEYNGGSGAEKYLLDTPATISQITKNPPTVQASNIQIGAVTNTTIDLSLTPGNGTNRIIVAKAGAAVDAELSDSVSYTADAAFGNGSEIGSGNFVVYNGSANEVVITGLSANTSYHFYAVEYNGGAGVEDYLVTSPATAIQTTTNAPSIQASGVSFSEVTSTSVAVSLTAGNGSNRIIVARAGAVADFIPVNGTTYGANADFSLGTDLGSGNKVVYAGTGSQVNVTGLSQNISYHFAAFEFNGTAGNELYLTSNPARESVILLPIPSINLVGFYSADFGTTLEGGKLSSWQDQSGSGNNASLVSGAGLRPAVVSDAINGRTAFRFSSAEKNLFTLPNTTQLGIQNSDYEIFIVARSSNTTQQFIMGNGSAAENFELAVNTADGVGSRFTPVTGTNVDIGSSLSYTDGNPHIFRLASSTTEGQFGIDRLNTGQTAGNTQSSVGADLLLGTRAGGEGPVWFDGDIAEVIIYNTVLSSNDREAVEDYLAAKYNIPLQLTNLTVQASNLQFSNVDSTSLDLSFTRGNGDETIILAKQGSAVDGFPSDSTTYTANSAFGSGTQIGNENFVVYKGSNNTISITGLQANSSYHFAALEYSGTSGLEKYLITNPAIGNETTLPEAPVFSISSPSAASSTSATITGTINPKGNDITYGLAYGNSISANNQVNFENIIAIANIGSGGSPVPFSVDLTSLIPDTTYYVQIIDSNGDFISEIIAFRTVGGVYNENLQLWLSGDYGATTSNGKLNAWENIINPVSSAEQSDETFRPTYVSDGINGEPALSFTTHFLELPTAAALGINSSDYEIFIVADFQDKTAGYHQLINGGGSGYRLRTDFNTGGINFVPNENNVSISAGARGEYTSGGARILNGTATSTGSQIRVDGVLLVSNETNGRASYTGALVLGQEFLSETSFLEGNIAEVLIYNKALSEQERIELQDYLSQKYNIPIRAPLPTVNASNLTFSNVTSTSMRAAVTRGDGEQRLVVLKKDAPVDFIPDHLTTYTKGDTLNGNIIAYNGDSSNVYVSGLNIGTTYHAAVFEFNGANGNEGYLRTGNPTGSQTTLTLPTQASTNLTFSDITTGSLTLTFTPGNGQKRIMVVRSGSAVASVPVQNTTYTGNSVFGSGSEIAAQEFVVYADNGNTVTITGLTHSTTYHFAIFEYGGITGEENYLTTTAGTNSVMTQESEFAGGDGTEIAPYQIATAEQLNSMRNYLSSWFELIADIDLNVAPFNTGEGWIPIGTNNSRFTGTLDGNNVTISNLYVNTTTSPFAGLFGRTEGSNLRNLILSNVDISSSNNYVGGLSGVLGNSVVQNVHISGTVTGSNLIGGLAGDASGSISTSSSSATVNGRLSRVGGLIGNSIANIDSSHATGNVTSTESQDHVGGLVGYLQSNQIRDSYATGNVTGALYTGGLVGSMSESGLLERTYATGNVTGSSRVGGLVGSNSGGIIKTSSAMGWISASNFYVGGLVGILGGGTIQDSYAGGFVESPGRAGGLVGYNNNGSIIRSYSFTTVVSDVNSGGLTGEIGTNSTITNSYWSLENSNQSTSASGTGKTDEELKQQATFTDWMSDSTWTIDEGISFPYLRSHIPAQKPGVGLDQITLGSGTAQYPYLILKPSQLDSVRNNLSVHYRLISDIDLATYLSDGNPGFNAGAGWQPIGTSGSPFTGNFDGNGQTISNLSLNRTTNYLGLFGSNTGSISKLILTNVSIAGDSNSDFVGGVAGESTGGTISKIAVTGSVSGGSAIGGMVGSVSNTDVSFSYSGAEVSGGLLTMVIGGLIGEILDDQSSVNQVYSYGTVSGSLGQFQPKISSVEISGTGTGGLIGTNTSNAPVTESYWNTETSTQATSAGGSGLTTAQSKEGSSYVNWDFNTTWGIGTGSTFPYLNDPKPDLLPGLELIFTSGSGSASDPFQISTPSQLDNIRFGLGSYYKLTADINLDVAPYNTGEGWEPIGARFEPFTGSLDGDGFAIRNLFIARDENDQGLFAKISGTVENLELANVSFTFGDSYFERVGSIAANIEDGTISNILANGTISSGNGGPYNIGGLLGYATNSSVLNSTTHIDITMGVGAPGYLGGVIGEVRSDVIIDGVVSTGDVGGEAASIYTYSMYGIGGLLGVAYNSGIIISNSSASGNVIGGTYTGGFIGETDSGVEILNSSATGNVTSFDDGTYVGGFIGYSSSKSITNSKATGNVQVQTNGNGVGGFIGESNSSAIISSFATGSVTSTSTGDSNIGGFIGKAGGNTSVSNSYSLGAVNGDIMVGGFIGETNTNLTVENSFSFGSVSGSSNVGGFTGGNTGNFSNSFWNIEISGQETSPAGTVKTVTELSQSATYTGWDFTEIWQITEGVTLPWLRTNSTSERILVLSITGTEGWRLLANPFNEMRYADMFESIWTQGFANTNAVSGTSNMYTWPVSATDTANTNWTSLSDLNDPFNTGDAVLAYVYSDDNYTEPGNTGFPKTLTFSGMETISDRDISSKLNTNVNGWSLIGNPFSQDVDWDKFVKTNLSNSVYVWDNTGSSWKTYNGESGSLTGGVIGAFNGFFVETINASPQLVIPDTARTGGVGQFLGKEAQAAQKAGENESIHFSLQISHKDNLSNTSWFQFTKEGSTAMDSLDAHLLTPLSARFVLLGSEGDDKDLLAINNWPYPEQVLTMPLYFESTEAGSHQISLGDIPLPEGWYVSLIDHEADQISTLEEPYTFEHQPVKAKRADITPKTLLNPVLKAKAAQSGRFSLVVKTPVATQNEITANIPEVVELSQNYPNPFNPSSIIQFGVPTTSKIQLEVFDLLGRKVAILIDGESKSAGRYSVQFDGRNLASGLYIYRLQVGKNILTKKMTLIK